MLALFAVKPRSTRGWYKGNIYQQTIAFSHRGIADLGVVSVFVAMETAEHVRILPSCARAQRIRAGLEPVPRDLHKGNGMAVSVQRIARSLWPIVSRPGTAGSLLSLPRVLSRSAGDAPYQAEPPPVPGWPCYFPSENIKQLLHVFRVGISIDSRLSMV